MCLSAQTPNIEGDRLPPDSYLLVLVSPCSVSLSVSLSSPQITPAALSGYCRMIFLFPDWFKLISSWFDSLFINHLGFHRKLQFMASPTQTALLHQYMLAWFKSRGGFLTAASAVLSRPQRRNHTQQVESVRNQDWGAS